MLFIRFHLSIPEISLLKCSLHTLLRNLSMYIALFQVLDEYQKNFGDSWRAVKVDNTQLWPYLNEALAKFQVSTNFALSCDSIFLSYFFSV